jgi:hypothetical protein
MVASDGEGQRFETALGGEERADVRMRRTPSPGGGLCFTADQILLKVRVELAQVMPESGIVHRITAAPALRERAGEVCDRMQVLDQRVPLASRVGGMREVVKCRLHGENIYSPHIRGLSSRADCAEVGYFGEMSEPKAT